MENKIQPAVLMLAAGLVAVEAQGSFVGNSTYYPTQASLANGANYGGSDGPGSAPLVIMGEYNSAGPLPSSPTVSLPTGTIQGVDFYTGNQAYNFNLYVLSPGVAGLNAEQSFTVLASQSFSGSASQGIVSLSVSPGMSVSAGDLLAFAGYGPWYNQAQEFSGSAPGDVTGMDASYGDYSAESGYPFNATPPGGPGTQFTVGLNGDPNAPYDYFPDDFLNQGRTYAIGVDVGAVPEPTTIVAGALLLLPFGASMVRIIRKSRTA